MSYTIVHDKGALVVKASITDRAELLRLIDSLQRHSRKENSDGPVGDVSSIPDKSTYTAGSNAPEPGRFYDNKASAEAKDQAG